MSNRRTHKKSRLGCQDCKRRHIKCNEARPACDNCAVARLSCVYQTSQPRAARSPLAPSLLPHQAVPTPPSATPTSTAISTPFVYLSTHASTPANFAHSPRSATSSSVQHDVVFPLVNMDHMKLFSHFIFSTAPSLGEVNSSASEALHVIICAALTTPYLMYQILGLAALHLSRSNTPDAQAYRDQAVAFQTQALRLFTETTMEVTQDNCVPMLAFSSLLGLHSLSEAVKASEKNAENLLDEFVTYLNLHRGVRSVIEQSSSLLRQSDLSSVLGRAERSLDAASAPDHEEPAMMADLLKDLLDRSDMSAAAIEACRDAVAHLKPIYQTELVRVGFHNQEQQATGLIWAWPILLSSIFTNLLMKRNPEALIILAHYAVLLHQKRHLWFVGNAGRMLIEDITRFLGTYWKQWLDWPVQILER